MGSEPDSPARRRVSCWFYGLLASTVALLSTCQDYRPIEATYLIRTGGSDSVYRHFPRCHITYKVIHSSASIDPISLRQAVGTAVGLWQNANSRVELDSSGVVGLPDLAIAFTDAPPVPYRQASTTPGLLTQPVDELAQLKREPSGSYTLYLNDAHAWTSVQLTRALAHLIGGALGLPIVADPASVMYPGLFPGQAVRLSDADVKLYQSLYNAGCNQWIQQKDAPFGWDYFTPRTTFTTQNLGNILFETDDIFAPYRLLTREYDPVSDTWRSRPVLPVSVFDQVLATTGGSSVGYALVDNATFYQYSSSSGWVAKKPIPLGDSVRIKLSCSFTIADQPYFFVNYYSSKTFQEHNDLWVYASYANTWTKKKSPFSSASLSFQALMGTTLLGKGYLLTGRLLYEYDPALDTWMALTPLPTSVDTNRATLFTSSNSLIVGVSTGQGSTTDDLKIFYEYKPQLATWQPVTTLTAKGQFYFSFTAGGHGYIVTDQKQVWEYIF